MRPPSPTLRHLRRAFRTGRLDVVLGDGDRLAEALATEPDGAGELAEVALLIGAAHARVDELAAAETYLEAGLDRWADEHAAEAPAPPGPVRRRWADEPVPTRPPEPPLPAPPADARWAVPPPPPNAAPPPWGGPWQAPMWTDTGQLAPDPWERTFAPPTPARAPLTDWFELLLCQVHLRTGRTADATDRLTRLVEPHRDVTTRFGATRALATVAALAGHHERAHHLLNTAGGLAARIPSRFRGVLAEADRAVVLARENRLNEALSVTERVVAPLIRPPSGPYQVWARREAAAVTLVVGRAAARAGDAPSAGRLLAVAGDALGPVEDRFLHAHLLLATAVVERDRDPDEVEHLLGRAGAVFERSGDRPAAALVALEQGRLAHRRGLERSARPRYRQAATELRACGWMAEARDADDLEAALTAGRPPTFRYGNVP